MSKFSFIIGLDPGASTGYGILRTKDDKLVDSGSADFWNLIELIQNVFSDRKEVKILVEQPSRFMYERNAKHEDKIRDNMLHKMGGTYREAQLLAAGLQRLGFLVVVVPPVKEKKWDEKRFRLFTGSTKKTSEHERDAVRLAFHYKNAK